MYIQWRTLSGIWQTYFVNVPSYQHTKLKRYLKFWSMFHHIIKVLWKSYYQLYLILHHIDIGNNTYIIDCNASKVLTLCRYQTQTCHKMACSNGSCLPRPDYRLCKRSGVGVIIVTPTGNKTRVKVITKSKHFSCLCCLFSGCL